MNAGMAAWAYFVWPLAAVAFATAVFVLVDTSPSNAVKSDGLHNKLSRMLVYLAERPTAESRGSHFQIGLGVVATVIFGLVPWAFSIMSSHPCWAWTFYALALACAGYTLWSVVPAARWVRTLLLLPVVGVFIVCAGRSIQAQTELDFAFVHPGVFLVQGSGEWLLIVSGLNTHRSIFNVDLNLQDLVTARSIPNEPDLNRRMAMIQGSVIHKHYDEIGPTFPGDKIIWQPIDVNNQEYEMSATFRIGETTYSESETIRIVNVGERFASAKQTPSVRTDWQESITVKNQSGEILMHCVDQRFPRETGWVAGPVCHPGAKFNQLPRSLCARCFKHGFEWYPQ